MNSSNSSLDLRNAYCDLYAEVRRYLWDIKTLEVLAEVEVECFTAFPDINKIRMLLVKLRTYMSQAIKSDEFLSGAFDSMDASSEGEITYYPLHRIQEVIPDEN